MKKEYFKIAKKIGVEIIEYKSYMSDLGCRVIYITVSYSNYKFSGDFGYWQNEKSFALSYFKKRLETFKMEIDLNTSTEVTQPTEPAIAVEPVLAPVFVYEFLYNSDCCEGAASTVSIHKTKKGAEMAMEFHKNEKLKEWEKECKEDPHTKEYPFDFDQWWGVRECELLP